jgi:hypothetical protein
MRVLLLWHSADITFFYGVTPYCRRFGENCFLFYMLCYTILLHLFCAVCFWSFCYSYISFVRLGTYKFDVHISVHRKYISKVQPQHATFSWSIYLYKLLYMFQVIPPPIIRSTKLYIERQVLSKHYCWLLLSWMRWNLDISIGFKIPDAVCTVLCSWWWAEESTETCRAIYRNKQIEKTLHLVGCTLEFRRNRLPPSSKYYLFAYCKIRDPTWPLT